jgi:hypothetical protein
MNQILEETLEFVRSTRAKTKANPDVIRLPRSRLFEFLDAASSAGLPKTREELEEMRRGALAGEARVWGVRVVFVDETAPISALFTISSSTTES